MKLSFPSAVVCLLASLSPFPSHAERERITGGTFGFYFENDLFAGTDRYYTNGVKLSWSSTNLAEFADTPYASPLLPLLNVVPFINEPQFQRNLTFVLGQNIYTPDNTESKTWVPGDRPYAGWLYVGVGIVWKNSHVRHSLSLDIGVVGPWSMAQDTQRLVHEARGMDVPNGWGSQLHNELGVLGVYLATWRWPYHERRVGLDWEFLPHAGLAVGNVANYANAGGELRVGFNLPDDFGTPSIAPGATTSTPVEGSQQADRAQAFDLGMYLFARADGRAVAHNIFLDGNTFGHGPSVDHKWLVGDLSVGASLNYRNTKFTYALVYRTKEFVGQQENQLFGSVTVNFVF